MNPLSRRTFLAASAAAVATTFLTPEGAFAQPAPGGTRSEASGGRVVPTAVGFTDHDLEPRRSSLVKLGFTERYGFDYDYRSIGADLGGSVRLTSLSVKFEKTSNDLTSRDISLYVSDDNAEWSRVSDVTVVNLGGALWLTGFDVTTRYVKVHCHRETTEITKVTTIVNSPQSDVQFFGSDSPGLIAGGGGAWRYRTDIKIDNPTDAPLRDRPVRVTFEEIGLAALVSKGYVAADLTDVRFLDTERRYLRSYADDAGFYIRLARLDPGESTHISLYSGNPEATDLVHADDGALQVEYGKRTIVRQNVSGTAWGVDVKPVSLPSGLVMLAAGSGSGSGVRAKFSSDDGRTWGALEQLLPPVGEGRQDSIGSAFVDPDTGVLTVIYYSVGARIGDGNWADPDFHSCITYWVQATDYDSTGRPIFGAATAFAPYSEAGGLTPSWFLTYCNPLKTASGAYLLPMSYVYRNDSATFTAAIYRSTDGGRSWTQGADEFLVEGEGFEIGISETTVMQMADGRIVLYARQQGPGRYHYATSTSTDDGVSFGPIEHSEVLASNTMPAAFRDRDGTQILTWSGHNAFGMESYQRNDITIAYSDGEGPDWRGYHDLLGATRLGSPGHSGVANDQGFRSIYVEADSAPVGEADRLFAVWANWQHPFSILVEDFTDYVRHSTGALDIPLHRNAYMANFGSELNAARWWRTLPKGTLDLVPGPRPVGRAIRLRGNAGERVAASRIFPAIRRGSIRFRVNPAAIAAPLDICLQEGFTRAEANARGGILSLRLMPDGELQATEDHRFDADAVVGFAGNDLDPSTGDLGGWAASGGIAFDYQRRSVGIDMRRPIEVSGVTLRDDDAAYPPAGTRLTASDLAVWVSDTNDGDWRRLADWTISGPTGGVFTLSGPAVTTRYLKISQPYGDTRFTFANDFGRILRITGASLPGQIYRPLQTPTTLPARSWSTIEADVDMDANTVTVHVDGTRRDVLPMLHDANVAAHLLIATGSDSTVAQEVQIDELIVRDLSQPDPEFREVKKTAEVPAALQR